MEVSASPLVARPSGQLGNSVYNPLGVTCRWIVPCTSRSDVCPARTNGSPLAMLAAFVGIALRHRSGCRRAAHRSIACASTSEAVAGRRTTSVGRHWLRWSACFTLTPMQLPATAESSPVKGPLAEITGSVLGPSEDVYYPRWFLGDWAATTELFDVEFPQGESLAGKAAARERGTVGTPRAVEQYAQRYMEYQGKIIADRAYNMRSYIRGSGGGPRAFESVDWEPAQPNTITVVIKRDGASLSTETRVTRRSVAVPDDRDDLFNASEVYQQIVSSGSSFSASGLGSNAKVTPIRCVNKFKRVSSAQIQVVQRIEVFPSLDGAAIRSDGSDIEKPVVIYKYRGILDRREDDTPKLRAL